MRVQLQVGPATHTFTGRYRLTLPASATTSVICLNLNGKYDLQRVESPQVARPQTGCTVYLDETLHQVLVCYAPPPTAPGIANCYTRVLSAGRTSPTTQSC